MSNLIGTKEVAKAIGIKPSTLLQAVWNGRMTEPQKLGRSFAWNEKNVQEAKELFIGRKNEN